MMWTAHSFLCLPDDIGNGLEARPMLGFAWGFRLEQGQLTLEPPRLLEESSWNEHVDALSGGYPAWRFPQGFADLA